MMRIRLQVAMGKSKPRAGASRTGPVTLARLQSSALREWDRLVAALETARRDPRRLGPWAEAPRVAARRLERGDQAVPLSEGARLEPCQGHGPRTGGPC